MKENFIHQKSFQIKLSAVIALLFLFVTFIASNLSFPISSEKTLLQWFSIIARHRDCNMVDSVLLIDTHYDKQMLMEYELDGDSLYSKGVVPVSNRRHLKALLEYLGKKKDYCYVLLDISFDKTLLQTNDSNDIQLYRLIASMPRLCFARNSIPLAYSDMTFELKAGDVSYYTTAKESDFVKLPYYNDSIKSLPLKMYEELTHNQIKRIGPICWDKGLARRSLILTFDVTKNDLRCEGRSIQYLSDLVQYNFVTIDGETKGKYILIGDFEDDIHGTYLNIDGEPGPIINFNAYLSLINGHHRISLWMALLLFFTFWFLVYRTLRQTEFSWLFMWIGYPTFLFMFCFIVYLLFNEVYDVLITSILFYSLKTFVDSIRNRKQIITRIKKLKLKTRVL